MRKAINRERVEGRVYEHSLVLKTVQNTSSENYGKEFIAGNIDVATDDEGLNIVTVHFSYVTPTFGSTGKPNDTFTALKNIIETGKTVLTDGFDVATMVRIDTALDVNDFYTNRNGEETLVTAKRNEGGFCHIISKLEKDESKRNTFEVDMLINGTKYVEADEEKKIANDYIVVKGCVFNFRNAVLPVELICKDPNGIKYFESLDASPSNLTFTKVWGKINSETIIDKREEESAFGEPSIKEYTRTIKEWVIIGAAPEAYEMENAETGITSEEIKAGIEARNVYLADVKKRNDEYQASKNSAKPAAAASAPAAAGGFSF